MAIPVSLRGDFKASQLRAFARKTKDGPQARRLLTLAAIYDGATRTEAAKIGGVTLQIIVSAKLRPFRPCSSTACVFRSGRWANGWRCAGASARARLADRRRSFWRSAVGWRWLP